MTSVPDMLRPQIDAFIKSHGRQVVGVLPDSEGPGFYYTIGNAINQLPELLLIARMRGDVATLALNLISNKQHEMGKPIEEGMLDIDWTFPFKIRVASDTAKSEYTVQAGQYLGHENYGVLQVMICDPKGAYQDDPACQYGITLA